MALRPRPGLPMATRAGDLDPGLVSFLARSEQMTAEEFHELVNHRCGLLGVSETSGDVRELLALRGERRRARPRRWPCFATKRRNGSARLPLALGGLDTLVFSGGIGEHSRPTCAAGFAKALSFSASALDPGENQQHAPLISAATSRVAVRVDRHQRGDRWLPGPCTGGYPADRPTS